jgi:hypothetical protein
MASEVTLVGCAVRPSALGGLGVFSSGSGECSVVVPFASVIGPASPEELAARVLAAKENPADAHHAWAQTLGERPGPYDLLAAAAGIEGEGMAELRQILEGTPLMEQLRGKVARCGKAPRDLWAASVVASRSFSGALLQESSGGEAAARAIGRAEEEDAPGVMVPVLDYLNHKPKQGIKFTTSTEAREVRFSLPQPVAEGQVRERNLHQTACLYIFINVYLRIFS